MRNKAKVLQEFALEPSSAPFHWEMGWESGSFCVSPGVCAVNALAKLLALRSEEKIERGPLYMPAEIAQHPNANPCLPGTLFNTCAFANNTIGETFGNAGRNIIEGPGDQTRDTSLVKQFSISEQKHFEFRAEFFNLLNQVNYLFSQFGSISAEPTPWSLIQRSLPAKAAPASPWRRARRDRFNSL